MLSLGLPRVFLSSTEVLEYFLVYYSTQVEAFDLSKCTKLLIEP